MRRRTWTKFLLAGAVFAVFMLYAERENPAPHVVTPDAPSTVPPLQASTGGLDDAGGLLAGTCFEYLHSLGGTTLVWTDVADQTAFYDAADASGMCAGPVDRPGFDFSAHIVAGAIGAVTGCDAAHRFVSLVRNDGARTLTLRLALEVRSGCPYELVEPFLVAVPRPPAEYAVDVVVNGP